MNLFGRPQNNVVKLVHLKRPEALPDLVLDFANDAHIMGKDQTEISLSPKPITENTLFYGDNLPILREYIPDEMVDLVNLDRRFKTIMTNLNLVKQESADV